MTDVSPQNAARTLAPAATGSIHVPFLDLRTIHASLKDAILADVAELIDSSAFSNGPAVREFEDAFARYCGTASVVGVGSGLDALRLALIAGGLEPGAEVIVPAGTFIATVEAVTQAGGVPVLVDMHEADLNLDVQAAESAIGSQTQALLPVHLYGQMADMAGLRRIAADKGLMLLEDACQAHGATRDGIRAGTGGTAGAFSFYPGKNLGAMGDAGALATDDLALAERVRALREHGQRRKYHHDEPGYTARIDTIQALVLLHKLPSLDAWNGERRRAAAVYLDGLSGVGDLVLPPVPEGSEPVWHLFVIRTAEPEALAAFLRDRGVASGRHYPQPIHMTGAYRHLGHRLGDFPVAERLGREGLSLPIYPGMTDAQVQAVIDGVRAYFAAGAAS
jgi:dTDP-4-amino-4,6-dideoxygalactose transaminase